ncbi:MAG: PQQ-binding-like beta-propeller repeat protein, partial [Planctomycetes bacterium]|nr:PQQ-binding-like beta-propeller repeat protein [Planctomycetota bacterium]
PGGKGDVTESHRLWHIPQAPGNRFRLGSGVIQNGYIYVNDMKGFAQCIDLKNGREVWNEKLKGDGATQESWSSVVLCDGKVYAINKSGTTFVFRASPKFELLATNSLDEYTNSSPIISNGQIFIRTHDSLWCIAKDKK